MEDTHSLRLTNELNQLLSTSLRQQNIDSEIITGPKGTILFIKLNARFINIDQPVYKSEDTMFGRALRLLTYLDKKHKLKSFINAKRVDNVMVSDDFNVTHFTKDNMFMLDTLSLNKVFDDLEMMGPTDQLYELSLKFLIDQNR